MQIYRNVSHIATHSQHRCPVLTMVHSAMDRCRPQGVAAFVTRDTQGKNALVSNTSASIRRVIIIFWVFRFEQKNPRLATLNFLATQLFVFASEEREDFGTRLGSPKSSGKIVN